jgi:glyoxylase-like metal-dependent hydrolase (beta-lactamase superfamily II)
MASDTLQVGNASILSLLDTTTVGRPSAMWPERVTEENLRPHAHLLDERGLMRFRVGSFLIRSSSAPLVLVDTGFGGREREPAPGGLRFRPGRLLEGLAEHGIQPEEIEIVLLTHLHVDHIGWNTVDRDGKPVPTFPRARYMLDQREWEYWTQPQVVERSEAIRDCVLPLQEAGRLDLIQADRALTSELTAVPTPGHTPGHISLAILSGGERGVITGDVAHSPIQLTETEWSLALDLDPSLAARTRTAFADRFDVEGMSVIGTHFPQPGFGRFIRLNGRRYWRALD